MRSFIIGVVLPLALVACGPNAMTRPDDSSCIHTDDFGLLGPTPAQCEQWQSEQRLVAKQEAAQRERDDEVARQRAAEAEKAAEAARLARRDRLTFHVRNGRALTCYDPNALLALSRPNARAEMGDINFMALVSEGGCAEIGNHLPLLLGPTWPSFSAAFQYKPGYAGTSRPFYILNKDLVGVDGRSPRYVKPQ